MQFNQDTVDAAVCLWEACLDNNFQHYARFREDNGAAETRDRVVSFAKQCHDSWVIANERLGFQDPFDWEWCPRFLRLCVDDDFTLRFVFPEAAALSVMKDYPRG